MQWPLMQILLEDTIELQSFWIWLLQYPHVGSFPYFSKGTKNILWNGLESKLMHTLLCQAQMRWHFKKD